MHRPSTSTSFECSALPGNGTLHDNRPIIRATSSIPSSSRQWKLGFRYFQKLLIFVIQVNWDANHHHMSARGSPDLGPMLLPRLISLKVKVRLGVNHGCELVLYIYSTLSAYIDYTE